MSDKPAETFTLTFGEVCENHAGMQKIGKLADKGFSTEQLIELSKRLTSEGKKCNLVNLNDLIDDEDKQLDEKVEDAYILIIRDGVDILLGEGSAKRIREGLKGLQWDKKAKMRGKVVNKRARYNLCFAEKAQEADYEQGKGTVVSFEQAPEVGKLREKVADWLGNDAKELNVEGNYYYDVGKCYIGAHGDAERKKVIAARFGAKFPLYYQWYCNGKAIGNRLECWLKEGDCYIMSEKATGYDWMKRKRLTLRHAAGLDDTKLFK